jgi:hypothetical protein
MATSGYSGTPLPQKLGIKEGHKVVLVGSPTGFELGTLPTAATVSRLTGTGAKRASGSEYDVLVVFVKKRDDLVKQIAALRPRMAQTGGMWIAWPKQTSGVPTDIKEDTIREISLPTGLVDNKVCAIDETWSGLRLVIRKENRKK